MIRWITNIFIALSVAGCGEPNTAASAAQAQKTIIRANNIILGGAENSAMLQGEGVKRITYNRWDKEQPNIRTETVSDYDKSGMLVREEQRLLYGDRMESIYTIDRSERGWQLKYSTVRRDYLTDQAGKIVEVRYGYSDDKGGEMRYDEGGNIVEVNLQYPLDSLSDYRWLYHYDQQNRLVEVESVIRNKTATINNSRKFSYGDGGRLSRIDYPQVRSNGDDAEANEMSIVVTPQSYDQRGNWLVAKTSSYVNGEYRGEVSKAEYEIEYW